MTRIEMSVINETGNRRIIVSEIKSDMFQKLIEPVERTEGNSISIGRPVLDLFERMAKSLIMDLRGVPWQDWERREVGCIGGIPIQIEYVDGVKPK